MYIENEIINLKNILKEKVITCAVCDDNSLYIYQKDKEFICTSCLKTTISVLEKIIKKS